MKLVWDESAWEDYLWWQGQDRKTLKRINTLIKDIARNGNDGIGKPEPLRHGFQGLHLCLSAVGLGNVAERPPSRRGGLPEDVPGVSVLVS